MLFGTTNGPASVRTLAPRLVAYAPKHVKGSAAATGNADLGDSLVTLHRIAWWNVGDSRCSQPSMHSAPIV
jgi:hypothetical protein